MLKLKSGCRGCQPKKPGADYRTEIKCIHSSGCVHPFQETQILRFLDENTYRCLNRLRTQKELRDVSPLSRESQANSKANLEGMVHCPFCEFAAIMEDPTDRIFECQSKLCGERSCRYCRVKSHHPLTCERKAGPFSPSFNL